MDYTKMLAVECKLLLFSASIGTRNIQLLALQPHKGRVRWARASCSFFFKRKEKTFGNQYSLSGYTFYFKNFNLLNWILFVLN